MAKERDAVATVWKNTLKEGETWFLIDAKWWQGWLKYSGFNPKDPLAKGASQGPRPGPIDNASLAAEDDHCLKFGIMEQDDYELLCEEVWREIFGWYKGGPVFARRVITTGTFTKVCRLEMYPFMVKLIPLTDGADPDFAKADTRLFDKSQPLRSLLPMFEPKEDKAAAAKPTATGTATAAKTAAATAAQTAAASTAKTAAAERNGTDDSGSSDSGSGDTAEGEVVETRVRFWMRFPKTGEEDETERVRGKDGWDVVDLSSLNKPLEEFGLAPTEPFQVLFEIKTPEGWPRAGKIKTWQDFMVGDVIDGQDKTYARWYEVTVKAVKENGIVIKFPSYAYNPVPEELVPFDSVRIAAKNTHSYNYGKKTYYSSSSTSYSSASGYGYSSSYNYNGNEEGSTKVAGTVGLRNLGNTCFMNSTLQCLSNTRSLTTFFVDSDFERFINRDNPLGWKGRVADEYGAMLKEMWGGKYRTVAPRKFKQVLGEFAPRFSGYQQQDSSELLSFLLDGLHEDLNQVRKKPATAAVDSNGRPDDVVAKEAWDTYLLRNKSVIVDSFQGQLKSKLVCPECRNVSITFDPFMFLSVPLPTVRDKVQEVSLVYDNTKLGIMAFGVTVSKLGRIAELKKGLAELSGVPAKRLVVADVWKNRVYRVFEDDASVSEIRSIDKIFAYELPEVEDLKPDKIVPVQVSHLVGDPNDTDTTGYYGRKGDVVGLPRIIALPRGGQIKADEIRARLGKTFPGVEKQHIYVHPEDYYSKLKERELGGADEVMEVGATREAQISLRVFWDKSSDYTAFDCERLSKHASVDDRPEGGLDEVPLSDCIREFAREETLSETDPWRCGKCKEFRQASKKFDLYKLPDVLIVHLKRFSYNSMWRDKISTVVRFPLEGLDLSEWTVNPEFEHVLYDLYAVSNHMGGMGGGHYTAYARNLVDNKWYEFDDSRVSLAEEKEIISSYAYVLYYERRRTPSSSVAASSASSTTSTSGEK